jgi:hypothetical protein
MPRLTSVEIRIVLARIADDATTHTYDMGSRAMHVARALACSAPDGEFHSDFVRAAERYVLTVAGHKAFQRAVACFDYAGNDAVCAGLDGAKHRIADRDGATAQAERELVRTWNRLFDDAPKADYCAQCDTVHPAPSDCCPITGQEYGTEA